MLCAFPGWACAQELNSSQVEKSSVSVKHRLPSRREAEGIRDALRRRAEAAERQGVVLREKQTEKDLKDGIAKFQQSGRLFKAASLNNKAADASLQSGEVYFT